MKREKVETAEKISKYQKQVLKFSKKISDGCGFKGLVLRAVLRCVDQVDITPEVANLLP